MFDSHELIDIRYALKSELYRQRQYYYRSNDAENKAVFQREINNLEKLIDKVNMLETNEVIRGFNHAT